MIELVVVTTKDQRARMGNGNFNSPPMEDDVRCRRRRLDFILDISVTMRMSSPSEILIDMISAQGTLFYTAVATPIRKPFYGVCHKPLTPITNLVGCGTAAFQMVVVASSPCWTLLVLRHRPNVAETKLDSSLLTGASNGFLPMEQYD